MHGIPHLVVRVFVRISTGSLPRGNQYADSFFAAITIAAHARVRLARLPRRAKLRSMSDTLQLYTDGSFDAASRSGGWAFVVIHGELQIHSAAGAMTGTSNNTFEVTSVVRAASWLVNEAPPVTAVIWTDSVHVVEGCNRWRHIWRGNGWKRVRANSHERRRTIPDAKLWQELDDLLGRIPQIRIRLCKGHSGIEGNEMADAAARAALKSGRHRPVGHVPKACVPLC
ncbi:ribonuclease H family protein [Agrobacterium vaccinii]|uniref:ribonuclease H family protein n=2 Tax=Agrobacterium TaxID=357 RepID=UPI00321F860B